MTPLQKRILQAMADIGRACTHKEIMRITGAEWANEEPRKLYSEALLELERNGYVKMHGGGALWSLTNLAFQDHTLEAKDPAAGARTETPPRMMVAQWLKDNPGSGSVKDIAAGTGLKAANVFSLLATAIKRGEVVEVTPPGQHRRKFAHPSHARVSINMPTAAQDDPDMGPREELTADEIAAAGPTTGGPTPPASEELQMSVVKLSVTMDGGAFELSVEGPAAVVTGLFHDFIRAVQGDITKAADAAAGG